jgi:hypothetical protein
MLAQVLPNDNLCITVDTDLAIVAVVKVALLAHNARFLVGKADLLIVFNRLPGMQGFFASLQRLAGCLDLGKPFFSVL